MMWDYFAVDSFENITCSSISFSYLFSIASDQKISKISSWIRHLRLGTEKLLCFSLWTTHIRELNFHFHAFHCFFPAGAQFQQANGQISWCCRLQYFPLWQCNPPWAEIFQTLFFLQTKHINYECNKPLYLSNIPG